ncbi:MAG: DUF427 domain-containing protein [bacterium]|nr:MAG: DUF427 domain-containing protein [bacterium]
MAKAVFNNTTIAEYDDIILLEGKHYFPPDSVKMEYLVPSETRSACGWKGVAVYYDVVVGGKVSRDSAWAHPDPSTAATAIKDHIAFGGKVKIIP